MHIDKDAHKDSGEKPTISIEELLSLQNKLTAAITIH